MEKYLKSLLLIIVGSILFISCRESIGGTFFNQYLDLPKDYKLIENYRSPSYDSIYIEIKYNEKSTRNVIKQIISKDLFDSNIFVKNPFVAHDFISEGKRVITNSKDGYVIQDPMNNKLGRVIYLDTLKGVLIYNEKINGEIKILETPLKLK